MNQAAAINGAPVKDPVCGMRIDPVRTTHRAKHGGTTYYFCSAGCAERFGKDPQAGAGLV